MIDNLNAELLSLGLTANETAVYLALLDLGGTSAGELIKKTNLHRNIVYDNLEKLIKKGLVNFIIIRGIKRFETTPPEELKEYIEKQKKEIAKRERTLTELLPIIEKKRKEILRPAEAAIFRGKVGLKNVLEELTSPKHELLIFATGYGMKTIMGSYYHQWHLKLKQRKVRGRAVISMKMKEELKKEKFPYEIRYLSEEYVVPSTIAVYGNKVITIIWQEDPILIVITSEEASKAYKVYFELLWKIAKE